MSDTAVAPMIISRCDDAGPSRSSAMPRPFDREFRFVLAVSAILVLSLRAPAQDVRVTVVTILASDKPGGESEAQGPGSGGAEGRAAA